MSLPEKILRRKLKKVQNKRLQLVREREETKKVLAASNAAVEVVSEEEEDLKLSKAGKRLLSESQEPEKRKRAKKNTEDSDEPESASREEPIPDVTNDGSKVKRKKAKRDTDNSNESKVALVEEPEPGFANGGSKFKRKKAKKDTDNSDEPESASGEEPKPDITNDDSTDRSKDKGDEPKRVSAEEPKPGIANNKFQDKPPSYSFESLNLSQRTSKAVAEMGLTTMTEIQARTIPLLLRGSPLVGAAKTGSGKTLAFLIPAVELSFKLGYKPRNGTGVIILSPTTELALQTYSVLQELMKYHSQTCGLITGEGKWKKEADKLWNGVNVLVATPGRLLDHMKKTEGFYYPHLFCLIIDEFDKMLDIGFEKEIRQLIDLFPKNDHLKSKRMNVLFSATQTDRTRTIMDILGLKGQPRFVNVEDVNSEATVANLQQGHLYVPSENRLAILYTVLEENEEKKRKTMVFFSSCLSVQFHHDLFNYVDLPVTCIHGKLKKANRISRLLGFSSADSGILLCTNVAARGLDIPAVDMVIQYDPPGDANEYIHRVGRTARGEGGDGRAVLFLREEERKFLVYLKRAKVPLIMYTRTFPNLAEPQQFLQKVVGGNIHLKKLARDAFGAYVRSYESHHLKVAYDVATLDMAKVAPSFGLLHPPGSSASQNKSYKSSKSWNDAPNTARPNRRERRRQLFSQGK